MSRRYIVLGALLATLGAAAVTLGRPDDVKEDRHRSLDRPDKHPLFGLRAKESEDRETLADARVPLTAASLMRIVERYAAGPSDASKSKGVIERLGADSFAERQQASRELVAHGRPVLAAVKRATEHRDPEIRRRATVCAAMIETEVRLFMPAARMIMRNPWPGAVRQLLAIRDDETRQKCFLVAERTSQHEVTLTQAAVAELLEGLAHSDPVIRKYVVAILQKDPGYVSIDDAIRLTKHESGGARAAGMKLLSMHAKKTDVVWPVVKRAIRDPDPNVRCEAATLVGIYFNEEWAADELIHAVKDEGIGDDGSSVAGVAAANLSRMKHRTKEVVAVLAEATRSPNDFLRAMARRSLGNMGRRDDELARLALPPLLTLLETGDVKELGSAAGCIGIMGPRAVSAVPNLLRALDRLDREGGSGSGSVNAFTTVISVFQNIGPGAAPAKKRLFTLLNDPTRPNRVHTSAISALCRIGSSDAAVIEALRDLATRSDPVLSHDIRLELRKLER